jgi:DNA polymerase zeta
MEESNQGNRSHLNGDEGSSEQVCGFSMRLIEVEPCTSAPLHGFDETWSSLEGRPIHKVPLLRLYGTTPAGQKCSVTVHNVYPYFFINIPDSVLIQHDTFEKLTAYALQLAHSLNKATNLNLQSKKPDGQFVHMVSIVQGKPFYGFNPDNELFFKVFMCVPTILHKPRLATH